MKVFVAGATGRVAGELIQNLVREGHQVTAGARRPEAVLKDDAVEAVHFDLHADVHTLADIVRDCDAVYFTAGSRGRNLLQTDAFGAVKLMEAAKEAGIKRFVMLSSVFADEPEKWNDPALAGITDYNIAKFFADQWLIRNSGLDYTIVQPGNLMDEPGSGKVRFGITEKSVPNAIPNVAAVLSGVLLARNTYGKIIKMSDGDTPITDAIAAV